MQRFIEKPSPARAALLRRRGALWNTGLFAWGVARFLGEAGAYARELTAGWAALSAGDVPRFFAAVAAVAVDVAVLERTKRFELGNVTLGDDVRRSLIWSENEHVAVVGVQDTVVVRANGHTLVMPTGQSQRLKALVQDL